MDIADRAADFFGMPPEIAAGAVHTELVGTKRLYVENFTELLEYKRDSVKLKFKTGVMDIRGHDFEIRGIGGGNAVIFGEIEAVCFI